ncbi:MAG: FHA domain-containing protein [Anaerolineales bacterium]
MSNVTIGEKNIALIVDKEVVAAQAAEPETGSVLPLDPPAESKSNLTGWLVGLFVVVILASVTFVVLKMFLAKGGKKDGRTPYKASAKKQTPTQTAMLYMKHGPQAGKSFPLNHLPVLIGSNPHNDICINDPHIIDQHARIFANNNTFYLMDLGGETVINGKAIQKSSVILKPGDVVRLGKRSLFVFG